MRQNAKNRARNRGRKQQLKSAIRGFDESLATGDAGKAGAALLATIKKLDKIAAKGTIHKNTAARKKSRLQRRVNALKKTG